MLNYIALFEYGRKNNREIFVSHLINESLKKDHKAPCLESVTLLFVLISVFKDLHLSSLEVSCLDCFF